MGALVFQTYPIYRSSTENASYVLKELGNYQF